MHARELELTAVGWTAEEKRAFLAQQFAAQHAYYHEHYQQTSFDVVLVDGVAAGRLYVARWEAEVRSPTSRCWRSSGARASARGCSGRCSFRRGSGACQ